MQEILNYILDNYISAKKETLKDNTMAKYIRRVPKDKICEKININTYKYMVKGSPGNGVWADIPWIALFDKDITKEATSGYYIVYLFCADMSGVYISLNQGWTYFKTKYGIKDGREKIRIVSNRWQSILSSILTDFSFDSIDLKGNDKGTSLARGYELGHICGKFYEAGKIPDDLILIEDLRNLMGVYRELKGKLKENSVEQTNEYLIVNKDDLNDNEDVIEKFQDNSLLIKENNPQKFLNEEKLYNFTPKKLNFLKKAKEQTRLGLIGELMVLNYEKERLTLSGNKGLAERVRHVSREDGDGAGYDILSFDLDGKEKYIEVKTTKKGKETPFMITENERMFSELNSFNYYLYRIFDLDEENSTGKLFVIRGNVSTKLRLKAKQYIVDGMLEGNL